MDVDGNHAGEIREMANGHKVGGGDLFTGPVADSPEPTNGPTPPHTSQLLPVEPGVSRTPHSMASGVQQLSTFAFSTSSSVSPTSRPLPISSPPDVIMNDIPPPLALQKPFREAPSSDEPPAKRLKTEPTQSSSSSELQKKLPPNQFKFLQALLRQMKKNKESFAFREPVDPVKLNIPRYFEVIQQPMDLSTIETKLNTSVYTSVQAVVDDFHLMIDNCVKFNGLENPITKQGKSIEAAFERGMKQLPLEQVSLAPP
jgi:bromodomain-containing factor 1